MFERANLEMTEEASLRCRLKHQSRVVDGATPNAHEETVVRVQCGKPTSAQAGLGHTSAMSTVELPSVASNSPSTRMHEVAPRPARSSHDGREGPTCRAEKTGYCLREGRTFLAGGVDQAARIEPRLTGPEYVSLAAALACQLTRRQRHQFPSAMQMLWDPDAWIEIEHEVHHLERVGRSLALSWRMVDHRWARSALFGIEDAVAIRRAGSCC
jgi:hypothetical protein